MIKPGILVRALISNFLGGEENNRFSWVNRLAAHGAGHASIGNDRRSLFQSLQEFGEVSQPVVVVTAALPPLRNFLKVVGKIK